MAQDIGPGPDQRVVDWLLGTDPAIRWQVLRDLVDAPEAEWRAERAKVETEGWGAELLSYQDADGQWAGGAFIPGGFSWQRFRTEGQPWTATCWALTELRDLGLDPGSEAARRTVRLIGENSRWDHDGQPYWEGEVEECINGRTVAQGAYFGVDVAPIVERLLSEQMADGGWNCERERGSVRSSFDSTLNVLEGLLEFEHAAPGDHRIAPARAAGEEYLLERRLMYRLSSGELVDPEYLQPVYPPRWQYTVVRALDYFRAAARHTGADPDPRLTNAVKALRAKQSDDGTWTAERRHRGAAWISYGEVGEPSPWLTLQSLRILGWWQAG